MSDRYYGALHYLDPRKSDDIERLHDRVVDTYDNARSHIDVAGELWQLTGDVARADAITALVRGALGRDIPTLLPEEVDQLLELMTGLEEALKRTILDENMNIRPERMPDVRQRAELIDVRENRGELAMYAVLEGLSRVQAARNILKEARERGLDVGID